MKRIISSLLSALLAALLFVSCSIQSAEDYYASSSEISGGDFAYISIDCKTILDNYVKLDSALKNEKYVPKNGVILEKTKYRIGKNDTAFSILQKAVKDKRIQLEFQGAEQNSLGSVYVQGINYLYERSCGELSGWFYSVNGEFGTVSAANFKIQDGDYVKWQYTCDLGYDLGADILG